ncbi:unnamed protein product, partial [Urochloa humidicola]
HGPRPARIWSEWHRIVAARTGPWPPTTASIVFFFYAGDRIDWPIVLTYALLLWESRRHRGLLVGPSSPPVCFLVATLRLCHSLALHLFADMRNLLGIPTRPTCSLHTTAPRWVLGLILRLCGSECLGVRGSKLAERKQPCAGWLFQALLSFLCLCIKRRGT